MTDDIAALRASIDAIDDKLIALLGERCGHVKKVGALKKKDQREGSSFIRAGREADMVRRIAGAFKDGPFPAAGGAQMWRIIISASLLLESPFAVSAFAPDSHHDNYWLAREYFGSFTPVSREPTAKRVLGDIMDGKAQVGIVPLPDDSADGLWWTLLPDDIKIFACIPFALQKNAEIKALAVARLSPEPTGNDVTLLRIETDPDTSQSRLKAAFDKHKLAVRWLAVENVPAGHRGHLVEITGFVTQDDKNIAALKAELGTSLLAICALGAYAVPLQL